MLKILRQMLLGAALASIIWPVTAISSQAAEYELRYSELGPPRGPRAKALKWWAAELDKRSGGRIKVKFFWSQSLVKAKATLKAVGSGLADTGTILGVYTPADLPLWNVANVPFLFADPWVGMRTMWEARQTIPGIRAETESKGVKILMNFTTGPVQLLSVKKPLLTQADLKGLKIRAAGGWSPLLKALGAVPVKMGFGEVYQALDRGTIDASINYTPFVKAYKHYEVAAHLTEANMGQLLGYGAGINLATWKKMSKDLQETLSTTSSEFMDVYARNYLEGEEAAKKALTAGIDGKKVQIHKLSDAESARWQEFAKPLVAKWLAAAQKRGHDGQAIFDKIVSIRDNYRKELAEKGYPWKR